MYLGIVEGWSKGVHWSKGRTLKLVYDRDPNHRAVVLCGTMKEALDV